MTAGEIRAAVEQQGWACGFASVDRLADLERDAARQASGGVAPEVVRERLSFYDFHPPAGLARAASLVVVALPLPGARVWFTVGGRRVPVFVPPGYVGYDEAGRRVRAFLEALLAPAGGRIETVLLPEKALAARIGLSFYGRNNLAYVAGMGSLLRLATFYTDLHLQPDPWLEPRELPRCASCRACARRCPTGAILADRFLLHAERCIVFHNERPSTVPFPDWIPASAHTCLVGCLECQSACPENTSRLGRVEHAGEFTEEETALVLKGAPLGGLGTELREKLDRSDLAVLYGVLSRNLRAVLSPRPS